MVDRAVQKNRDAQKKYAKKYPEKIRARFSAWYERNKSRVLTERRVKASTTKAKTARKKTDLAWREANPEAWAARKFRTHLKTRYKLTVEQYETILAEQNGVCAICFQPENPKLGTRLCVDHDHKTGKVRGLLCRRCNSMCGQGNDDPARLIRGAQYLTERSG